MSADWATPARGPQGPEAWRASDTKSAPAGTGALQESESGLRAHETIVRDARQLSGGLRRAMEDEEGPAGNQHEAESLDQRDPLAEIEKREDREHG